MSSLSNSNVQGVIRMRRALSALSVMAAVLLLAAFVAPQGLPHNN